MIPLWATANSHQTQLKINQLGFFIPPKMACRVNRLIVIDNSLDSLYKHSSQKSQQASSTKHMAP